MKPYKINLFETYIDERIVSNPVLLERYDRLFNDLLDSDYISGMEIFEAADVINRMMTTYPLIVEPLLRKENLPDRTFLICSN